VHFVCVQNEYSLLHREPEREVLAECERQGLAFLPYFPLASGLLTGKYSRGVPAPEGSRLSQGWAASRFMTDDRLERADALKQFAESRGHTLLELAISWLVHRRAVASVIAGATSPVQVDANVRAASWPLTDADLAEIDRIVAAAA
jgi:aryl-alcohol dehydrogenase-like predicted oxidoreductase